ncbi:MAG: glycosyltransferase family 2 protein [Pseudomonadota bacterium]
MTVLGVTCLRDEGPYIVDWLAHHRALGFAGFVIVTHDCADGADTLLDVLDAGGAVTHVPFRPKGDKTVQWQALRLVDRHPRVRAADRVLFFDVDEYLNLPEPMKTVGDLVAACGAPDAISVPWRLFGSAQETYEDRPVTERFTRCAPRGLHYPLAHLFKTICRPRAFQKLGVHRPRLKKDTAVDWRLADGAALLRAEEPRIITAYGQPGFGQVMPVLNHYSVRSAEEFVMKGRRGLPNHADRPVDLSYWAERNWCAEIDTSIARFATRVNEERNFIMGLPGVSEAHSTSVTWHQNRIAEARADIEVERMIWRLGLLAGSTPPPAARTRAFIAAQLKARADG